MKSSPEKSAVDSHLRVNDILLGPIERKLLAWFSPRMPLWVTPDVLTMTALAAGVIIAASYALTTISRDFLWVASLGIALHWFGDSLDGTLARYRGVERPRYGYFIDHSLDTLVEFLVALGMGFSPLLRLDCALFALAAYLMMSVSVNIRTCVTGVFRISYGKLGPTEFRVAIIIFNTIFYFTDNPVVAHFQGDVTICDLLALATGIILLCIFTVSTALTALELRRQERSLRGVSADS